MSMPLPDIDPSAPTPLQSHYLQCVLASGGAHRLRCIAESIGAFVAPRIVSLMVFIAFLVGTIVSLQFGSP
jgi:hypothetical protein